MRLILKCKWQLIFIGRASASRAPRHMCLQASPNGNGKLHIKITSLWNVISILRFTLNNTRLKQVRCYFSAGSIVRMPWASPFRGGWLFYRIVSRSVCVVSWCHILCLCQILWPAERRNTIWNIAEWTTLCFPAVFFFGFYVFFSSRASLREMRMLVAKYPFNHSER